jgi:hypothetical protein
MNISLQNHIPFIIRHVVNGLLKEPKIKKNKTLHDVFLMFLTLGLIIISIQINIPNIKSNKPFPNCKQSFVGFPLNSDESDLSSIEYIACIILFAKQHTSPWNILHKYNKASLVEQLLTFIKTYILTIPEITNKLQDKSTYLSSLVEIEIPFEHNIAKWVTFMPCAFIVKYIPNTFKILSMSQITDIIDNPWSTNNLHILSILYQLSINIQLKIANVIIKKTKEALLKTKSGHPYVENSCCIDHDNYSTIRYFMNEDSDIRTSNEVAIQLSHIYNLNSKLIRGNMFSSLINTARRFPNILTPHLHINTIYAICIYNIKHSKEYTNNLNGTLAENIKTLNDSGMYFSEADALPILKNKFLATITRNDVIHVPTPIELLYTHLNYIQEHPADIVSIYDPIFLQKILQIIQIKLDNNEPKYKKDISVFRNYLQESVQVLFNKIKTSLSKINQRVSTKQQLVIPFLDESNPNYLFTNFVSSDTYISACKDLCINMSQIFPNIILHKTLENADVKIPAYWKLHATHVTDLQDILKFKYMLLSKFYSYLDMSPLLTSIIHKTKSFIDTIINSYYISINDKTNISRTIFDAATTKLLFKYYIHLLIHEMLKMSTDTNIGTSVVENQSFPNKMVLLQHTTQYIQTCFEIALNNKTIVNKEVKSISDSIINIKNIEKNNILENLGKLTDDERMSNTVLKMLKLKRWSVPKNLRSYTKSGYAEDAGIYDEDDAFNYDATEYADNGGDDIDQSGDGNDEADDDAGGSGGGGQEYEGEGDNDIIDADGDLIDPNWDDFENEFPDDLGDTIIEDGDYSNLNTMP